MFEKDKAEESAEVSKEVTASNDSALTDEQLDGAAGGAVEEC